MTDFDLMCKADISLSTLNRASKGNPINIGTLTKLKKALRCKPEDLMSGNTKMLADVPAN